MDFQASFYRLRDLTELLHDVCRRLILLLRKLIQPFDNLISIGTGPVLHMGDKVAFTCRKVDSLQVLLDVGRAVTAHSSCHLKTSL